MCLLYEIGVLLDVIVVIGLYGQMMCYCFGGSYFFIMQLGDFSVIVECCGIDVVVDFCCVDVVVGGQGVFLLLVMYVMLLVEVGYSCVVLNLGGIVNFMLLVVDGWVLGFDIGLVNGLMDVWCQCYCGELYDCDGVFVVSGKVDVGLLQCLFDDVYFV